MKLRSITIIPVVMGVILPATTLRATTFTFNGSIDNTWNTGANWSPSGGPPGSTDTAIIPFNKDVTTNGENVGCQILKINANGPALGTLFITQGSTFSLYGGSGNDSTVNGEIAFDEKAGETATPILEIVNSTTIKGGDRGEIIGRTGSGTKGIIRGESNTDVLTWAKASGATNGPVIAGEVDVEVNLVNNARVIAGNAVITLTLKTNPKSGSGLWEARTGTLRVDVAVTGTGNWLLDTTNPGTIRFTANCDNLGGDFTVKAGTLDIQGDLCTSGDIDWTGGSILVDNATSTNAVSVGGTCTTP